MMLWRLTESRRQRPASAASSLAALPLLSLLLISLISLSAAASSSTPNKNARSTPPLHNAPRSTGKRAKRIDRTQGRALWQNPLWATPNTDLLWSAKEQPHHGDPDWSAKEQQATQPAAAAVVNRDPPGPAPTRPSAMGSPTASSSSAAQAASEPRPPGNPFENIPPSNGGGGGGGDAQEAQVDPAAPRPAPPTAAVPWSPSYSSPAGQAQAGPRPNPPSAAVPWTPSYSNNGGGGAQVQAAAPQILSSAMTGGNSGGAQVPTAPRPSPPSAAIPWTPTYSSPDSNPAGSSPSAMQMVSSAMTGGINNRAPTTTTANVRVEGLRIALYGLSNPNRAVLASWEDATASYFELFYNEYGNGGTGDPVRDAVFEVKTKYEVTSMDMAQGRRDRKKMRGLLQEHDQGENRELQDDRSPAILLTYSQTTQYFSTDNGITPQEALAHPFQTCEGREDYAAHLRWIAPQSFGDLEASTSVMVPAAPMGLQDYIDSPSDGQDNMMMQQAASSPVIYVDDEGKDWTASMIEAPPAIFTADVRVDGLRIALYGLGNGMSTNAIAAWEDATASYFELFYNEYGDGGTGDPVRDAVFEVQTVHEVTSVDVAGRRRGLMQASSSHPKHQQQGENRELQDQSAILLTYSQTTQYSYSDEDMTPKEVLAHPFQTSQGREDYAAYLRWIAPQTFGELEAVTSVMVPASSGLQDYVDSNYNEVMEGEPSSSAAAAASPYASACNLCRPGQVGLNNPVTFNGRPTSCSEVYDFMAKRYDEGSSNCVEAQRTLSGTCCGAASVQQQQQQEQQFIDGGGETGDQIVENEAEFEGDASRRFCGFAWSDVIQNCLTATPCPQGYADGVCPDGMACIADTPCPEIIQQERDREAQDEMEGQFEGDASQRFCGYSWDDAVQNCLTTTPCPQGYAEGVCPDGMSCFADTPCAEEVAQAQPEQEDLIENSANMLSYYAPVVEPKEEAAPSFRCVSDSDCPNGLFCNTDPNYPNEYCVPCLPSGRGCLAGQVCADPCGDGGLRCYDRPQEGMMTMTNELPPPIASSQQAPRSPEAMYVNPEGNSYFCGYSFAAITDRCLESKPCLNGYADDQCQPNEGCFFHPACKTQYDAVAASRDDPSRTSFAFGALDVDEETMRSSHPGGGKERGRNNDQVESQGFEEEGIMMRWNRAPERQVSFGLVYSLFAVLIGLSLS